MSNKKQYQITVKGRVQGVGFRHSAKTQARFLGLKGFVKNKSDGSVYIEAEGTLNQLNEFVNWCKKGPGFGYVDHVHVETGINQNYSSFRVRF